MPFLSTLPAFLRFIICGFLFVLFVTVLWWCYKVAGIALEYTIVRVLEVFDRFNWNRHCPSILPLSRLTPRRGQIPKTPQTSPPPTPPPSKKPHRSGLPKTQKTRPSRHPGRALLSPPDPRGHSEFLDGLPPSASFVSLANTLGANPPNTVVHNPLNPLTQHPPNPVVPNPPNNWPTRPLFTSSDGLDLRVLGNHLQ
jgi:hypothetical protein